LGKRRSVNATAICAILIGLVGHGLLLYLWSIANRDGGKRIPALTWHGPLAEYAELLGWLVAVFSFAPLLTIGYVRRNSDAGNDAWTFAIGLFPAINTVIGFLVFGSLYET
jgi:uncharacterized membrane protein YhaH (DUF805 family)